MLERRTPDEMYGEKRNLWGEDEDFQKELQEGFITEAVDLVEENESNFLELDTPT